MRGRKLRTTLGVAVAATLAVSMVVSPASAAVDHDRESQTILGVGSDTLYEVMNDLAQLYNESPGCAIIQPPGSSFTNYRHLCLDGGSLAYSTDYNDMIETENLYHDRVVEAYPVGSGAGATSLTQFTLNGSEVALESDYARSSSKRTFSVAGHTGYGVALYRDAAGYWVGSNNKNVFQKKVCKNGKNKCKKKQKKDIAAPNLSMADLKNIFVGNASGQCALNWNAAKAKSVKPQLGTPGSGNVVAFSTPTTSGSGLDFLRMIDSSGSYSDAAALQNCIPAQFKDGIGNNDRVIFENLATPICNTGGSNFRNRAIFPYSYGRFVQNNAGGVKCAGVLGSVDGIAPTLATIGRTSGNVFPMATYRYNYFLVPDGVDVNDPDTWGDGKLRVVLEYLHPTMGWLCKTGHSQNPASGVNYAQLIKQALRENGAAPIALGPVGGATFSGQSFCRDAATT